MNDSFGPFNVFYRIKGLLVPVLLTFAIFLPCFFLFAQSNTDSIQSDDSLHLRKRKKTIEIFKGDFIGITTATDTLKYFGEKIHGYKLIKVEKNNFVLRKPLVYKDTVVESNRLSLLNGREHVYGKPFRTKKNGMRVLFW